LDPAVYDAARTYLNLAESHKVVLEDALKVVRERSQRMRVEGTKDIDLSDLVIHDCFTGGSVPGELFTSAFWRQLAMSIKPSGILVVVSAARQAALVPLTTGEVLPEFRWRD
jgi:spermidine synthase